MPTVTRLLMHIISLLFTTIYILHLHTFIALLHRTSCQQLHRTRIFSSYLKKIDILNCYFPDILVVPVKRLFHYPTL